jgi:predicted permease
MSTSSLLWKEIVSTFLASVRSVGTACTLAGVGVYLHQKGFVVGNGKRTLALIAQQVTIPLLFFTKILYCNQDWSSDPCPNITDSLRNVWILLVWPLYVCCAGLLVGFVIARLAKVPSHQRSAILVAVGFGNSTGLPITLLTVIHSNFASSTDMGRVDPTLFLSVYLLLYPVLQWGIGGWLLAPTPDKNRQEERPIERIDSMPNPQEQALVRAIRRSSRRATHLAQEAWHKESQKLAHNVLNRTDRMSETYQIQHRGLDTLDASLYMSVQENLNRYGQPVFGSNGSGNTSPDRSGSPPPRVESIGMDLSAHVDVESGHSNHGLRLIQEQGEEPDENQGGSGESNTHTELFHAMKRQSAPAFGEGEPRIPTPYGATEQPASETTQLLDHGRSPDDTESTSSRSYEEEHLCTTCAKVVRRCLQPPVVGAMLGLFIASFPTLRGVFVDIVDRTGDAPLEWFFDGLYTTGQAAVPLNMMILGCNLSASYMLDARDESNAKKFFSRQASVAVVVGKMIVMPAIGYVSALVMQYVYPVPDEIAGSFYLVLLIVFLCPTANNVMVMVELSGDGSKVRDFSRAVGGCLQDGNVFSLVWHLMAPPLQEGMARIIAYQYMVAPVILSLTVTGSVLMATSFSSNGSVTGAS